MAVVPSLRLLATGVLVASLPGCVRPTGAATSWSVRFGPVIGSEEIVGRVVAGSSAWIATGGGALVHIDLQRGQSRRYDVHPLADGEHIRGLASTDRAGMWTLIGHRALARITREGLITRRIALAEPHAGIFTAGRELVFQVMSAQPPADALAAGPPGGLRRHKWSHMRTRALRIGGDSAASLNLVSCGATAGASVPCWFPDEAALTLTDASGLSREIVLDGLPTAAAEALFTSDNPRRPVRDAFVSATNAVWVIGSGASTGRDDPNRPGGWLLARYDSEGRLFRRVQLPEPARMLLAVSEDKCLLLTWDGRVVEVRA
jgi:hypothetical protein